MQIPSLLFPNEETLAFFLEHRQKVSCLALNKFEIEESSKVIDLEVAERIQLVSGDKSGLLVFYSLYSKSALRVIKFDMGIIASCFTPKNQLLVSLSEKDKVQFKSKIVVIEGDKRSEIMPSRFQRLLLDIFFTKQHCSYLRRRLSPNLKPRTSTNS